MEGLLEKEVEGTIICSCSPPHLVNILPNSGESPTVLSQHIQALSAISYPSS